MNRDELIEIVEWHSLKNTASPKAIMTAVDMYSKALIAAKPDVIRSLPTDVTLKDIKQIRNYFGEHDVTMFEHKAYLIMDKILNHLNASVGNDV